MARRAPGEDGDVRIAEGVYLEAKLVAFNHRSSTVP
jgi:hypothetical protein